MTIGFRRLFPLMWVLVGVALVIAGLAMWAVASSRQVGISLDGSRRWVTFSRVHPDFAEALLDREPSIRGAGR